MSDLEILCEKRGTGGFIVLNRPAALNALTLGMVRAIAASLDAWEHDPQVHHVVVTAVGDKAFCAGGDIRLLYEQGQAGEHEAQLAFWGEEYVLNRRIKLYPKPYISLIDGIVMGGGVGVSMHGSHRVAGDRFMFAMPEVGIGFFPDVGATYFLPRLPGKFGTYLALTGGRVKAGDAVALGLATSYVPSAQIPALVEALSQESNAGAVLQRFAAAPLPAPLLNERAVVDGCFDAPDVSGILNRLDANGSEFAKTAAKTIRSKSPMALAIALRQMQIGGGLDIAEAMRTEFRVVSRVCRGHEFYEGIRATIIDKDNAPRWQPASIDAVTTAEIDAIFAPLGDDELHFPDAAQGAVS